MSRRAHWRSAMALATMLTVAVVAITALDAAFRASPVSARYARAGSRLVQLSEDASEALRVLIAHDEVTWDPTNSSEMESVFAHLRRGRGERVLLLGSSQLTTLRDDRSLASYARRVDKLLEQDAGRPVTVYNLSVSAMTTREKALVLERAVAAERIDRVVLALTLWDSMGQTRRSSLARLATGHGAVGTPFGSNDDRSGPAAVNKALAAELTRWLDAHVAFFRDRAAIRAWMGDRIGGNLPSSAGAPAPSSAGPASALPMQYTYTQDDLARAAANVASLLGTAADLEQGHGFHVTVLLTPFRQDGTHPAYDPRAYAGFRAAVRSDCARHGFDLVDASDLLDASHFGPYEMGENLGRIDVFHFDAKGHEILAATLARAIGLEATSRRHVTLPQLTVN